VLSYPDHQVSGVPRKPAVEAPRGWLLGSVAAAAAQLSTVSSPDYRSLLYRDYRSIRGVP
jgi:hypothetical protein